jgi:hypothetical protein
MSSGSEYAFSAASIPAWMMPQQAACNPMQAVKVTDTKKPENSVNQNFQASHTFKEGQYGGSCRIRTYDQLVKSQLLYQLS